MRYGVALPYIAPRAVAELARQAEEAGWDGCFLGDAIWCHDPLIGLAAAAMTPSRIRLGMMIVATPMRRPWRLASESLALDHLSDGRLVLGLGTGAVWMGWQAFPDEITDAKARAGMLDETIDLLTRFYERRPFDYEGEHYHLQLTALDEIYYPPKPVQQPRIPLWVVGIWPRKKSLHRTLKGDGLIVEMISPEGKGVEVTPEDLREITTYVETHRTADTPFDIVVNGSTASLDAEARVEKLRLWREAGATWWIEGLWDKSVEEAAALIAEGAPQL